MRKQSMYSLVTVMILTVAGVFYAKSTVQNARYELNPTEEVERDSTNETIEGRVFDVEGQPVGRAKVCTVSDDPGSSLEICDLSDENGNFRIPLRRAGAYTVYGSKEEEGYADTLSGFHQEGAFAIAKVNVQENEVLKGVEVRLGLKAERLEGVITEAATGKPVSRATITLRRVDDPRLIYRINAAEEKKNGKFKVLVPHVPFTIEVESPDYETWKYSEGGSGNQSNALRVNPGEIKRLVITLRPKTRSL